MYGILYCMHRKFLLLLYKVISTSEFIIINSISTHNILVDTSNLNAFIHFNFIFFNQHTWNFVMSTTNTSIGRWLTSFPNIPRIVSTGGNLIFLAIHLWKHISNHINVVVIFSRICTKGKWKRISKLQYCDKGDELETHNFMNQKRRIYQLVSRPLTFQF